MHMQKRSWLGKNKAKIFAFVALAIISFIFVMPLIYGIFGSFRKYTDFMYHTDSFLPSIKWVQHALPTCSESL